MNNHSKHSISGQTPFFQRFFTIISVGLCALLLGACVPDHEVFDPTAPVVEDLAPEGLIGYLSMEHPANFFDKGRAITRRTPFAAEAEMGLSFGLGVMGYPRFEDFAAGKRVGVFLFRGDEADPVQPVLMARVDPESPAAEMLANLANLTIETVGDWTLFAEDPEILAKMERIGPFVELLNMASTSDLEFRLLPSMVEEFRDEIHGMVPLAAMEMGWDPERLASYADWLIDEIQSVSSMGLGFSLAPEAISLSLDLEATTGSDLRDLFQDLVPAHGIEIGRSLAPGKIASSASRWNPEAVLSFQGALWDRLLAAAPAADHPFLISVRDTAEKWLALTGSSGVWRIDSFGEEPNTLAAFAGSYDSDELRSLLDATYLRLMGTLLRTATGQEGFDAVYQFQDSVETHEGLDIHYLGFEFPETTGDPQMDALFEELAGSMGQYIAIVEGHYYASENLETLKDAISGAMANRVVEPNLAEMFTFGYGDLMHVTFDLGRMAREVEQQVALGTGDAADSEDWPPLTMQNVTRVQQGMLLSKSTFSVDEILDFVQKVGF